MLHIAAEWSAQIAYQNAINGGVSVFLREGVSKREVLADLRTSEVSRHSNGAISTPAPEKIDTDATSKCRTIRPQSPRCH